MVQLIMCLVIPFFTGRASEVDADGNVTLQVRWNDRDYVYDMYPVEGEEKSTCSPILVNLLAFVRYTALLSLYGGIIIVCTSIYVITPRSVDMHSHYT